MNVLKSEKKLAVVSALVEGASIRSTERMTGVHRDTIMRLLLDVGQHCEALLDAHLRNVACRYVQVDEAWCYVAKKQRRVRDDDPPEFGDQWIFVALDAETKLVPCYAVGKRTRETTYEFLLRLQQRLAPERRFQLTTDGFRFYVRGVEDVFAGTCDFAQLIKLFGEYGQHGTERYSPSPITEVISKVRDGRPDPRYISTSYVERQNLTMRMQMRRFTRLTNGLFKKLANLRAALALYFTHYNFVRVHQSLRVTPAMQARVTDRVWTLTELIHTAA